MKIQRVYIDTSVIGGCFDDKFSAWSNGLFQDFKENLLKPVISDMTAFEIQNGAPEKVLNKFFELLEMNPEAFEITEEIHRLASNYIERGILTEKFIEDAVHIATATVAEVDILTSWNFKHIVRYDKIRQFSGLNLELGYKPIQIYSPMEVAIHGRED